MLPAPNLRRAPKASKALRARRVLRASKAHRGRKALKANRVRLGRKPLTASKVRLGRKVSASKDRPDCLDCKARREKQVLQDRRLSAKKVRPARKGRREKQVPQGHKDRKVRRAKQASKVP